MSLTPNQLLAYAFYRNHKYSVKLALALGADPNQEQSGRPLLLDGIQRGVKPKTIKALLKSKNINLNVIDSEGISALFYALAFNRALIPILLDAGIDPNLPFVENGPTALLTLFHDPLYTPPLFNQNIGYSFPALDHINQAWITQLLIKANADLNTTVTDGYTALHSALLTKNQQAILALLAAGVDVKAVNSQKYTALAYALKNLAHAERINYSVTEAVDIVDRILDNDLVQHTDYPPATLEITMKAAVASLTESSVPEERLVIAQTYRLASRLLLINNALNFARATSHYYWDQLSRFIALDVIFLCNKMFKDFATLPSELRRMLIEMLLGDMTSRNGSYEATVLHAYRDYRDSLASQAAVVPPTPEDMPQPAVVKPNGCIG